LRASSTTRRLPRKPNSTSTRPGRASTFSSRARIGAEPPPLDFIIAGGQEVGDVDVGYGPARALRNAELKETVAALDPISAEILRERFDPPQMMKLGIYPEIWDRDPAEDDTLAYLVEYFEMLKPFLARGAASGLGVLIYVN
jgi:hypothetical protein